MTVRCHLWTPSLLACLLWLCTIAFGITASVLRFSAILPQMEARVISGHWLLFMRTAFQSFEDKSLTGFWLKILLTKQQLFLYRYLWNYMRQYQRKQFSVIFLEKALLKYSITLRYTLRGNIIRVASFSTNLSRDTVAKDLYSLLQTLRENIHLSCRLSLPSLSLLSIYFLHAY